MSKEFSELVREIGETRSKDEEIAIMRAEVSRLRQAVATDTSFAASAAGTTNAMSAAAASTAARQLRELLIRLIYCEMLGFEVPFGYMIALNASQHPRAEIKRAGYLAVSLFLDGEHELNLLNTNSMRKGLESPSHLEVCAALTALSRLVTARTVPVFFPPVRALLRHSRSDVRKKAVIAIHAMMTCGAPPEDTAGAEALLRDALCDKDPVVMATTLGVLRDLVVASPAAWNDLVPALVSILTQVVARKLPRSFDYNSMPAPWVQVHTIDSLAALGRGNAAASEKMVAVLGLALKAALSYRLGTSSMVVYSCVRAIMAITPHPELLEMAAAQIGAFLRSGQPNLRYLGVRALAAALAASAENGSGFAKMIAAQSQTQMAVIECLESDDDTLRRETLDVLYLMSTEDNAQAIANRLLDALRRDTGSHIRSELVARITQIAERFFPTRRWYLQTLSTVLDLGGAVVPASTAEALARTLDPRSPSTVEHDEEYHSFAAEWFARAVAESLAPGAHRMPASMMQVAGWVLGEHGHRAGGNVEEIIGNLVALVDVSSDHGDVQAILVTAIGKLCARSGVFPANAAALFNKLRCSSRGDLQQRAREFIELLKSPTNARAVVDAAAAPTTDIDPKLPFLDDFVQRSLAAGAKPYAPHKAASGHGLALVDVPVVARSERLHVQAYPAPRTPFTMPAPALIPAPAADLQPTPAELNVLVPTPSESVATAAAPATPQRTTATVAAPSLVASALGASAKKSVWTTRGYAASSTITTTATTTAAPQTPTLAATQIRPTLSQTAQPQSQPMQQQQPQRTQPHGLAAAMTAEEQRRAKIARDLFGSSPAQAKSAQPKRPPPVTTTTSASTATPTATGSISPRSAISDLLSLETPSSLPAQSQAELMLLSPTQPAMTAPTTSVATTLLQPATAMPTSASPVKSVVRKAADSVLANKLPATPYVAEHIKPTADSRATLAGTAGNVAIYVLRLFRNECLGLAILTAPVNEGSSTVESLNVSVDAIADSALQFECHCAPGTTPNGQTAFAVSRVPSGINVVGVVKLHMRQPLASYAVRVGGKMSVGGGMASTWEIAVGIEDFVRTPQTKMTTAKVGSLWASFAQERKVSVAVHAENVEGLATILASRLHFTLVEIIGTEALMCGTMAAPSQQQLCLVHCRTAEKQPDGILPCTVSLRTEAPQLADSLAKAVTALLQ